MRRIYLLLSLMAMHAFSSFAGNEGVTLTINGKTLTASNFYISTSYQTNIPEAAVECIYLEYETESGTYQRTYYYPAAFNLIFGKGGDGIENLSFYDAGERDGKLRLEGLPEGTPVQVFDTAGRLHLSTTAGEWRTRLSLNRLPKGVYMIRAGKAAIKFTKK